MDGFKFVSNNLALNEEKIFKILPKTGHLVLLKKTNDVLDSSYYNETRVIYNSKNLIKKAIEEAGKKEVQVQGKTYPEISSYRKFIGQQYAVVYSNNHGSLALRVFIKFNQLKNLRMVSKIDKTKSYWNFIVNPGQTVMKKLHPIHPFEVSEFKGMSTELFIVKPKKTNEECQKDLKTPKKLSRNGQSETTISRSKENRGINSNINHQKGLAATRNNIDNSPDLLLMNDLIFDVEDSCTPQKLIKGDSRSKSNIKFGTNQKILKLKKEVDPTRYSSITARTSYKFEKE